jgi:thiol-disulfide isomerase/thioredoxin
VNSADVSPGRARLHGLLALAAVLLVSGAVGFITYRLLVHRAGATLRPGALAAASRTLPPTAAELPEETTPLSPSKVPERLPDIGLPGLDGRVHRLTEWKGRPLVINFWATWCEPCRREIPLLQSLRRKYAANGLEIVGIGIDQAGPVRKYASDHGIGYPLLLGEREGLEAAKAFGMETVLPFSVFSDREGRVVTLKIGELHADEAELILDRIRDVDAGRLSLAAAQTQISTAVRNLREARTRQD